MKFAMNGALTVGTLDGANIEIKDAVSEANMFLFGLTTDQVMQTKAKGYDPMQHYYGDHLLRTALDAITNGVFSPDDPNRFRPIVDRSTAPRHLPRACGFPELRALPTQR